MPQMNPTEEDEFKAEVLELKRHLQTTLHSYESVIFYFQQLLVWEKPSHSALFVFILHLLFWYLKVCSTHVIGFVSGLALVIFWLDMWKDKIWPEIRAVAPDPNEEDWGELHPRLPMLPELCHGLAEILLQAKYFVNDILKVRQETPTKFCFMTVIGCCFAMFIGQRVPGILLAYVCMLCCITLPVIWYRRLFERMYKSVEPFFMQLQYSMKPKMKRPKKHYSKPVASPKGARVEVVTDSSGDDDDMSSFVNPLDAKTADLIARALTDESELSDSDESLLAHECPSLSSHGSSLDGDKETRQLAELHIPEAIPKFEDPEFTQYAGDNFDSLGVPVTPPNTESQTPGGPQELLSNPMKQVAASVIQETVSNVLINTASTLADWSKKQSLNDETDDGLNVNPTMKNDDSPVSSENDFVILDNN